MPRRRRPDPLAHLVGARIRQLREEAGLTLEKLAYESDLGSKGHLSDLEKGLTRPNVHTLKVLADHLGLLPLDLLTFPEQDQRQRAIDAQRPRAQPTVRSFKDETPAPRSPRRRPQRKGV
jgi:transcriptional regulator with XRE-family HTH domain